MPSQLLRGSAAEATTHLTLAFNGTVPSNAIYSSYTAEFARVGEFALANSFAASYANETNAALTTRVLTNLGVTAATIDASSYATLASAVETAFAAYPTARGQVSLNLARLLSGLEGDATYGAAATAWNTNAAAAFTYSSNVANVTSTTVSALTNPVVVNQAFTLTTSADKGALFTGGLGNDTFDGLQSTASTYQDGDVLDGGAGADTLNIVLRADPDSVGSVLVRNIETIVANVQATDATGGALDASQWTGVATLSNAGSTAGTLLSVSGLALTTTVRASGNTDVTLDFRGDLSGTADAASVLLDKFGTGTATTLAGTGEVTLGAGVDAVNVTLAGTNFAAIDGADLVSITLAGSGQIVLGTDAPLTRLDASALTGVNTFTFSGAASTLSATGGASSDLFVFLTGGLSNADSIAGGEGTDTLRAVLAGTSAPTITGFETATFLFTQLVGNYLDLGANASGWNAITVSASANSDVELANVVAATAGLTVNLNDSPVTDFTLDTNTGASVTLNIGSASGAVAINTLVVTDATTLNIRAAQVQGGSETINMLDDGNSQTRTLTVANGATGSLTIADMNMSAVQSVTLSTSGSGGLTVSDGIRNATAITSITIRAEGSDAADVTLSAGLFSGSGAVALDTVTISASTGADVIVPSINLATRGSAGASAGLAHAVTVGVSAGSGSFVGAGATAASGASTGDIDLNVNGVDLTLNLNGSSGGIIVLGDLLATGTGVGSIVVNAAVGQGGIINIDDSNGTGVNYTLSATVASSGTLRLGLINQPEAAVNLGTISLPTAASAEIGAIDASSMGATTITLSSAADINVGSVTATSRIGGLTINVGTAASAGFGGFAAATSGGPVSITLSSAGKLVGNTGGDFYSAGKSLSSVAITLGTASTANFGDINASSIGTFDVQMRTASSAEFKFIGATGTNASGGSIGSLNFSGAGAVLVSDIHASSGGQIGSVTLTMTTAETATFTKIGSSNNTIGTINATVVSGASASFDEVLGSAIGALTVGGAGNFSIVASGSSMATADFSTLTGTVTANFAGVISSMVVNAGGGTNVLIPGLGDDTINLKTAAGTDTIILNSTAAARDTIVNFQAGTGSDVIRFGATAMASNGVALTYAGSAAAAIATGTVSVDFGIVSGIGATTLSATDNIIVLATGQFTALSDMRSAIATGGSIQLTLGTGATAGSLLVVWQDTSGNSNVSIVAVGANATGIASGASAQTLVTISGTTPNALVTANFDFG